MMIPEAWENDRSMDAARRAFYEFHATLMEPWDGPAAVAFTDGTVVGAVLDRNGLRPGRWWRTSGGLVVLASEAGVLDFDPGHDRREGTSPAWTDVPCRHRRRADHLGRRDQGRAGGQAYPYEDWLDAGLIPLESLPVREHMVYTHDSVQRRQQTFGYTEEELTSSLARWPVNGIEPIGSMGTDTPVAPLSTRPRLMYRLLHPAVRAGHQPSAGRHSRRVGHQRPHDDRAGGQPAGHGPASCHKIVLNCPVLDVDELAKIIEIDKRRRPARIPGRARLGPLPQA